MAYKPNKKFLGRTKKKTGGGDWWDPERNVKNYFRILPAWDKRGIVIFRRVLHYGFEVDGRGRAFPCLEDNDPWLTPAPCPSCHVASKMLEGNEDEREAGKGLQSGSPRFVCQGYLPEHIDRGILKYAGPISFGRYVISLLEDEDLDDITDPNDGYDIVLEVTGKGRGTKYDYRIRPKPTPIKLEGWESDLQDLIKIIEVLDQGAMIEALRDTYSAFDIDGYLEDFKGGKALVKKYTWKDLKEMKRKDLLKLVEELELDVEDDDWDDTNELREVVSEELEEKDMI